jgi:hypothetical protein
VCKLFCSSQWNHVHILAINYECYIGESPSSSASDIENLNSHGVSKATSTKGRNSPQVAGNLLPLAVRNQAHLLRLLAYVSTLLLVCMSHWIVTSLDFLKYI